MADVWGFVAPPCVSTHGYDKKSLKWTEEGLDNVSFSAWSVLLILDTELIRWHRGDGCV